MQPVEFVKFILILFLAKYFSGLATKIKTSRHFLVSAFSTFVFVFLVLLQPDFGSALILAAIWLIMIIAAGFPKNILLSLGWPQRLFL